VESAAGADAPFHSPLEAEAARLSARDPALAHALRRSTLVGAALLKVEADEAAAVAALADGLLEGDADVAAPAPACAAPAAAAAACFRGADPARVGAECRGAVAALEACARAAAAARVK